MVASPEVCRMNGARSQGPVTIRGKAISSRNATKHGLLAQQPPLLMTEDLSTFQGIVQGLIDCYQPISPVEHHLIQQVAMGMLRQQRLWATEAAIANEAMATQQRRAIIPMPLQYSTDITAMLSTLGQGTEDYGFTPEQILQVERGLVQSLLQDVESFQGCIPKQRLQDWAKTARTIDLAKRFHASLKQVFTSYPKGSRPSEADQKAGLASDHIWMSIGFEMVTLERMLESKDVFDYLHRLEGLGNRLEARVQEIDALLAQLDKLTQRQQEAQVQRAAIGNQQGQLLAYEQRINKSLYGAIDRLEAIKQSR